MCIQKTNTGGMADDRMCLCIPRDPQRERKISIPSDSLNKRFALQSDQPSTPRAEYPQNMMSSPNFF
jgi:hypothetical protein